MLTRSKTQTVSFIVLDTRDYCKTNNSHTDQSSQSEHFYYLNLAATLAMTILIAGATDGFGKLTAEKRNSIPQDITSWSTDAAKTRSIQ